MFSRGRGAPFLPDLGLVFGDHVAVASDLLADFFVSAHDRDISYSHCAPLSDLLIPVTLELGYGVATADPVIFQSVNPSVRQSFNP